MLVSSSKAKQNYNRVETVREIPGSLCRDREGKRKWCSACRVKRRMRLCYRCSLCAGCCLNKQKHMGTGAFTVLMPTWCPSPPSALPHESLGHSCWGILPWQFVRQHTEGKRCLCLYWWVCSQRSISVCPALPGELGRKEEATKAFFRDWW